MAKNKVVIRFSVKIGDKSDPNSTPGLRFPEVFLQAEPPSID